MKPATLDYAQRPKRRMFRLAALITAAVLLLGGLLYWRIPIQTFLVDRYQAWKFASSFDRAHRTLFPSSNTLWTPNAQSVNADALIDKLIAAASSPAKDYRSAGPNLVLFVRSGQTSGQKWLAFASITKTGLEVVSFNREYRQLTRHHWPFEMPQFWGLGDWNTGTLELVAGKVTETDDRIITEVNVNGGRNVIEWSITTAPLAYPRPNMANAVQVISKVTPQTGWISNHDWWPNVGDVVLLEGSPPDMEVNAVAEARALSFVPDGRIALMAPQRLALVDPQENTVHETPFPQIDRPIEIAAFSQDGAWCYAAKASGDEFLISTLGGAPVHLSKKCYGQPNPIFLDDRTLIVHDNTRIRRFDYILGAVTEESKRSESMYRLAMSKDVIAYKSAAPFEKIHVRRGQIKYEIANDQNNDELSLSPDAKCLAAHDQRNIFVYDVETGLAMWELESNHDLGYSRLTIKWSSDSALGVVAGRQYVYVWSTKAPRWAARFPHGRIGNLPNVAISEDGKELAASATGSSTIAYWPDIAAAIQRAK